MRFALWRSASLGMEKKRQSQVVSQFTHFSNAFATVSIYGDGFSRKSIEIAESLQLNGNLLQARIIRSRSMNKQRKRESNNTSAKW